MRISLIQSLVGHIELVILIVYHKKAKFVSKKICKRILVRSTTFCPTTMVYRAEKNMKDSVRVKLDLTEKRYNLRCYATFTLREMCPNTDQKKFRIWTLFTQCNLETKTRYFYNKYYALCSIFYKGMGFGIDCYYYQY